MSDIGVRLVITKVGDREALDALNNLDAAGRRIVNSVSANTGLALGNVAAAYHRAGQVGQDAFRSVAVRADMAADAMKRVDSSTNMAGAGFGRLRMGLTSAVAQMTGVSPLLARIGATAATMEAGMLPVIAVLAAIAAGVSVWKAWHEEADKANAEQKKLNTSLMEWYEKQKLGRDGLLLKEIDKMKDHVVELRKELDKVNGGGFFASLGAIGAGGSRMNAWLRVLTAGNPMQVATQFQSELMKAVSAETKAMDDGGKAISAANTELEKRRDEDARKAHDSMVKRYTDLLSQRRELVKSMAATLSSEDDDTLDSMERINRAANRDDQDRKVGKINLMAGLPSKAEAHEAMKELMFDINTSVEEAISNDSFLKAAKEFKRAVAELAKQMHEELGRVLGDGLAKGFEAAFTGRGIGDAFKSLTATVLSGLGDFLEKLGASMLITGTFLTAFASAVKSLDGPAAIAAGVGLIAAGAALKAVAGSFGSGTSSGGYAGSTGLGTVTDRGTIALGSTSAVNAGTVVAQPSTVFNLGVINPNDGLTQRIIDQINRANVQRGSLAGAR